MASTRPAKAIQTPLAAVVLAGKDDVWLSNKANTTAPDMGIATNDAIPAKSPKIIHWREMYMVRLKMKTPRARMAA